MYCDSNIKNIPMKIQSNPIILLSRNITATNTIGPPDIDNILGIILIIPAAVINAPNILSMITANLSFLFLLCFLL